MSGAKVYAEGRWWNHNMVRVHHNGLYFNPNYGDVVMVNHEGVFDANIAQRVHHQSPDPMRWGDHSGATGLDLAMNILDLYVPAPHLGGHGAPNATRVWDGHFVHDEVFRLYRPFNMYFVLEVPDNGGVIRGQDIVSWLGKNGIAWTPAVWAAKTRKAALNAIVITSTDVPV